MTDDRRIEPGQVVDAPAEQARHFDHPSAPRSATEAEIKAAEAARRD